MDILLQCMHTILTTSRRRPLRLETLMKGFYYQNLFWGGGSCHVMSRPFLFADIRACLRMYVCLMSIIRNTNAADVQLYIQGLLAHHDHDPTKPVCLSSVVRE